MKKWKLVLVVVLPITATLISLFVLLLHLWKRRKPTSNAAATSTTKLRDAQLLESDFGWDGRPCFRSEVADDGSWSKFMFPSRHASPSGTSTSTVRSMQLVRLTPPAGKATCVCMNFPLPGPALVKTTSATTTTAAAAAAAAATSFPREAYFEMTILHRRQAPDGGGGGERENVIALGLSKGGVPPPPVKVPGSYPGSIGFCSDGAVLLEGRKIIFSSEQTSWGQAYKVVGCGFDPSKKSVIFTVDSELLHVIPCTTEAFKSPMHPMLYANRVDVMVTVNKGQKPFRYAPANGPRTSFPGHAPSDMSPKEEGEVDRSVSIGFYDHSGELFSPGRSTDFRCRVEERRRESFVMDVDVESDLFEIPLGPI